MPKIPAQFRENSFHLHMSEFWSGDIGLTLVTLSLVVLVFVITPLRQLVFRAGCFSICSWFR